MRSSLRGLVWVVMVAGLAASVQARAASGAALFASKCQICHSVAAKGAPALLAPNLRGLVGRKAASSAFPSYSAALKKSGLTWTSANLDTFLAAPGKLVPGTRMVIGVPDARQRADLIAWLATQR